MLGARKVVLRRGHLTIGRDAQCDLTISDGSVSRRHARFDVTTSAAYLEDLNSKNGVQVNGQRLTSKQALSDGAVVLLGGVLATFHVLTDSSQSTETISLLTPGAAPQ